MSIMKLVTTTITQLIKSSLAASRTSASLCSSFGLFWTSPAQPALSSSAQGTRPTTFLRNSLITVPNQVWLARFLHLEFLQPACVRNFGSNNLWLIWAQSVCSCEACVKRFRPFQSEINLILSLPMTFLKSSMCSNQYLKIVSDVQWWQ